MEPEWLIVIQDRKDAGEKRVTCLQAHLDEIQKDPKDMWKLGGFSVAEHVQSIKDAKLTGSALIGKAPTLKDIESRVKRDIFYTGGVWDPETLIIVPFVSTMRKAL